MSKELVDSIKWIVPPKFIGDIAVAEEATVLNNPVDGIIIMLYRSGDVAQGVAMGMVDAVNLVEMLNKGIEQIKNKAN